MGREAHDAAPQDFEELRDVLVRARKDLPKRLSQIATYSLDNPDEIAFGTVARIAVAAGVQPSALVRFAQYFGFEGFSGLQQIFRARLLARQENYEERLKSLAANNGKTSENLGVLNGFLDAAGRSVARLSQTVDGASFERAVAVLGRAETIYLIAQRRAAPLSVYMAYGFATLGVRCQLVANSVGIEDDLLALAGPQDAAIAMSFAPYASASVNQTKAMVAKSIPLISITDSASSPLVAGASEWLEVVEADHAGFRSLSAGMALVMALSVAVAEWRRRQDAE